MSSIPPPDTPRFPALHRIGDAIAQVCAIVAAAALSIIVIINGMNVVNRYVFGRAFAWAEEMMIFLMILIVFAGAVTVTWRNAHIRIDLLVEHLPPAARRIAAGVVGVSALVVLAVLDQVSFRIVSMLYAFDQRSLALEVPLWIPQGFVSVGLLLIALMLVLRALCPPRADAASTPTS
jgi:TRAP-type C4-dicarboxylate transport system permease small subunit